MTSSILARHGFRVAFIITLIVLAGAKNVWAASPAPSITSKLTASGQVGVPFTYQISSNRNPATFNAAPLPAGLTVSTSTGMVSGTPTSAGTYDIVLTATNGSGSGTATLVAKILPQKPVVTSPTTANAEIGAPFSYQIVASNSPSSYTATGLPTGITVNTATGVISGISTTAGSKTVAITATNAAGTGSATLTITTVIAKPTITSLAAATGKVGQVFQFQISATNSPTTFSATGLPAGLVVNTSTGLITGTPTAAGSSQVTLAATNAGGSGSAVVPFTITSATPVITSGLTAAAQTGVAFSYTITATQQPSSFGATGLPAGLTLDANTGSITGIPVLPGTSSITITAANTGGTGSAVLLIQVSAGLPYTANFEVAEGYAFGPLNGQLGWVASSGVSVVNTNASSGTARVQLNAATSAATMSRTFASSATNSIVYIDFFARPAADAVLAKSSLYSAESSRWSFQKVGGDAVLQAFDGSGAGVGTWVTTDFASPLAADSTASWIRLTARADFARKKWDLYANSQMVAADLSFFDQSSSQLRSFATSGGSGVAAAFDDFYAGLANPLFVDANNNGIEDTWETSHGLTLASDNRDLSPSGNGVSVVQSYVRKLDPNDFYSGSAPTLSLLGGDQQTANPNAFNASPFAVKVSNAAGTAALPNAPVTFTVLQGGGLLGLSNTLGAALSSTLAVRTDTFGTAQVFYQQPATPGTSSLVQASAGSSSTTFRSLSSDESDTDGDGMADAWELRYLATKTFNSDADPGRVGRTLLQSFTQGLSPWPLPSVGAELRLWFRASLGVTTDSAGLVERWVDLSGQASHVVQSDPLLQPVLTAAGVDSPAFLSFSGDEWLRSVPTDVLGSSPDATVLLVIAPDATQLEHAVVAGAEGDWNVGPLVEYVGGTAGNRFGLVSSLPSQQVDGLEATVGLIAGQFQLLEFVRASGTQSGYLNGAFQGSETYSTPWSGAFRPFVIGSVEGNNFGFRGRVAEIRIYGRALSLVERVQVESELASQYGLPGGQIVDTDGDGLSDAEEVVLGTNRLSPDHPDVALQVTLPAENTSEP